VTSTWNWSGLRSWGVHAYTASGAVLALLIVLAAVEGDVARALWLGLAALVIDGTDGMLARRFGVKERLPWFDGALLDNIVDYLTYVHFFLGFPSYWNVVAFYAIALDLGPTATSAVVLVCAALVLVPIGYLYPSRMTVLRTPTLAFSAVWLVLYAVVVAQLPSPSPLVVGASLLYIAYYCGLSLYLHVGRSRARSAGPLPTPSLEGA
jgi:phosphatidylcholine synthase